jgi:hypothetical protein
MDGNQTIQRIAREYINNVGEESNNRVEVLILEADGHKVPNKNAQKLTRVFSIPRLTEAR